LAAVGRRSSSWPRHIENSLRRSATVLADHDNIHGCAQRSQMRGEAFVAPTTFRTRLK
jgi:hypothetical protein